ncbi:unnamed protein product [Linum trigynum]|uniref:Uncharacterized protein n=1 Tax=Linum trigynum TaxID=586398 RepID=A0AAV2F4I9_9ROSI
MPPPHSSSEEDDKIPVEESESSSSPAAATTNSTAASKFFAASLSFTIFTSSSGMSPKQSMYVIRSPADRVATAAAADSSQQFYAAGEISPTSLPSESRIATDVCLIRDWEIKGRADDAGSS